MGTPILIGRDEIIENKMKDMGLDFFDQMEIHSKEIKQSMIVMQNIYINVYKEKVLKQDCLELYKKRNVFAACMVSLKEADAMVCGLTRSYAFSGKY